MKATFFEYNVAMSGIFTARANLNVVSHNIANAAIPGYSRQQTIQQAATPLSLYNGKGMYGTGSVVTGIMQIRDKYLDNKYWEHKNVSGEYKTKNQNLEMIETVFNNLSDVGVLTNFEDFFERLQDLSQSTPDQTYRSNVVSAAETLSGMIRSNAESLQKHQRDINGEVETTVTMINSLGSQIASMNEQIKSYERDGSNANDLRDQRVRLIDQLSELVNITVEERDFGDENIPYDKRTTVLINGHIFVNDNLTSPLMVVPRDSTSTFTSLSGTVIPSGDKLNEMDVPGLYDIHFANTGAKFDIYSPTLKGTLKGLIDVRDGNNGYETMGEAVTVDDPNTPEDDRHPAYDASTTTYKGIPFYMNKLNTLVRTFARAINEGLDFKLEEIPKDTNGNVTGHMYGYDYYGKMNGETINGRQYGDLFFTTISGRNTGSSATQLGVQDLWEYTYTYTVGTSAPVTVTERRGMPQGLTIAAAEADIEAEIRKELNLPASAMVTFGTGTNASAIAKDADGNNMITLDYDHMNALTFTVNPELNDSLKLACSSDPSIGESNNDVILDFGKIGSYSSLFREGELLDFVIGVSDHLAIDKEQADNFEGNYEEVVLQTDNQRMSVSGVDTNEELMAMIRYNQLFVSCSKLVNVINQIYDTMINRLGV